MKDISSRATKIHTDAEINAEGFADLHVHTVFSDGTATPKELILLASKQGLAAISVVDHDTVDGIAPAVENGKKNNIEVIPGIELTAEYDGLEIHVLGYFIDYNDERFKEELNFLRGNRIDRVHKIVEKLKGMGVALNPATIFEIAKNGTVGRLHIARAMVQEKIVSSVYEAFKNYLGDTCPAYVCGFRFTPRQAIELIKDVSGIPVLAHPYSMNRDDLIPEFIHYGLMGLEAYYPEHSQSMINFYLGIAKKYNLLVTGGSDFHGDAKPEVKIGAVKIPYELVNKLKQARQMP